MKIRPASMLSIDHAQDAGRTFVVLLFAALLAAISITACVRNEDLTLEQRQHQLERELMCPVCDGQTLDQSQAQISRDMKGIIIEKLQAGETNTQIKDYFVARYGEQVLAAPTSGGINLLAWLMPVAIAGGGAAIVFFALRGMRRPAATVPPNDRGLAPYLERVDREIGLKADRTESGPPEDARG